MADEAECHDGQCLQDEDVLDDGKVDAEEVPQDESGQPYYSDGYRDCNQLPSR